MTLNVLDCTLRDGGYYNNWDFSPDTVRDYINAVSKANIDIVEIGFRFTPKKGFLGAHAYTTDTYLDSLDLPDNVRWAVMCNASDLVKGEASPRTVTSSLFQFADRSPVSLVRIATHFEEALQCRPALERLKELGYSVGFNLMQVGGRDRNSLLRIAEEVETWGLVDVLYFADSLGNMDASSVQSTISTLQDRWRGALGIHAHDNMGRALTNTLAAIKEGVSWVDATICGMGRGPGNARMEYLLLDLARHGTGEYKSEMLFPIVVNDFQKLLDRHGWGPNLLYFLSAAYSIHPTYVQEMLNVENYNAESAIIALEKLRESDSKSYNYERLQQALKSNEAQYSGTWSAANWAKGKTVLVVGSGPWIRDQVDALVDFIKRTDPVVISLNTNSPLPDDIITSYAACHFLRLAMEGKKYTELDKPLIAPRKALPESVAARLNHNQLLDFGMTIQPNTFSAHATGCTIPTRLAAAYALAFANAAGASKIFLAGFDGYDPENPLQKEMETVFSAYHTMPGAIPLEAVTPTTYSINQSSIFDPKL